jgi:hypothetical protein
MRFLESAHFCNSILPWSDTVIMSASTDFYTKAPQEHWLRDKQEEGGIVILEDDSRWEISPPDRRKTARWLRVSTIAVEPTQSQGYAYVLKNAMDQETALANYIGKLPSAVAIPKEAA